MQPCPTPSTHRLTPPSHPILDRAHEQLTTDPHAERVHALIDLVDAHRRSMSADEWRAFAEAARAHPVTGLLHQDPYTQRAFAKPRGYAGDAVMLDYLTDDVARALLGRLWSAVRPGGRLVVANFADDSRERGYMEAFMDWWLIYRSESDLRSLASTLGGATITVFRDPTGRTVWLEARRS